MPDPKQEAADRVAGKLMPDYVTQRVVLDITVRRGTEYVLPESWAWNQLSDLHPGKAAFTLASAETIPTNMAHLDQILEAIADERYHADRAEIEAMYTEGGDS